MRCLPEVAAAAAAEFGSHARVWGHAHWTKKFGVVDGAEVRAQGACGCACINRSQERIPVNVEVSQVVFQMVKGIHRCGHVTDEGI